MQTLIVTEFNVKSKDNDSNLPENTVPDEILHRTLVLMLLVVVIMLVIVVVIRID